MQATAPIPSRDLAHELMRAKISRVYVLVHGNPINDANGSSIQLRRFFFFGECSLKKKQNAPKPSERPPVRGKKFQMILVQMYNIFRLLIGVPGYCIVRPSGLVGKLHIC